MYIFRQAKNAILDFDKYPELLKTKFNKVVFYALFFVLFFNFLQSIFVFAFSIKHIGFDNFVEKYVPDFEVLDDKLVFEKYEKVSTPVGITFIFDPKNSDKITKEDMEDVDNIILKITPSSIISPSLNIKLDTKAILKAFDIQNKSDLVNIKYIINIAILFGVGFSVFIFIFLDILIFVGIMLFVNVIVSFYKIKFELYDTFKLTVYASTTAYLLKKLLILFFIRMPLFIYIGVILAYLHFALKIISSDKEYNQAKIK